MCAGHSGDGVSQSSADPASDREVRRRAGMVVVRTFRSVDRQIDERLVLGARARRSAAGQRRRPTGLEAGARDPDAVPDDGTRGQALLPGQIADVSVYKNTAFVNSWSEETCKRGGFFSVDISDPANPKQLAFVPARSGQYHGEGAHAIRVDIPAGSRATCWRSTTSRARAGAEASTSTTSPTRPARRRWCSRSATGRRPPGRQPVRAADGHPDSPTPPTRYSLGRTATRRTS